MTFRPCDKCNNGYVVTVGGSGIETATLCDCLRQERFRQRLLDANIHEAYHPYLSLGVKVPKMSREQRAVHLEVKDFVGNISDRLSTGNGLYLYGPDRGTGKTTHLLIILRAALAAGHTAKNVHWSDFYGAMIHERAELNQWMEVDALMLDEIGKEGVRPGNSEFPASTFEYVIRHRTSNGKSLFMASNMEDEEMNSRYGTGIDSLLGDKIKPMPVHGVDWRRKS